MKTRFPASLAAAQFIAASLTVAILSGCREPIAPAATALGQEKSTATKMRVIAAKPTRQAIEVFTVQPARIRAFEEAPIFARVAGIVAEVPVDIGDKVARGDILARIDAPELLADVRQKEALVAQAEAEIKQAAAAVSAKESHQASALAQVASVQAGVQRSAADRARWQAEYARVEALAAARSVTQKLADETKSQLDGASAALEEAEAKVAASRALVEEAKASVEQAKADAEVASAKLAVSKANLAYAQTMAGYLEITAPFDGAIVQRNVDAGHVVEPGEKSAPLLAIAAADKTRVLVDIPENLASLTDVGDVATVTIQGIQEREFPGKVSRTSWALDATNRSLRVEIDLENENGVLRPGAYAQAKIRLDGEANALCLPLSSIFYDGERAMCAVVRSGRVERTPIELGLRGNTHAQVVSRLDADAQVVVSNGSSLPDGQEVEAAPPEALRP